MTSLTTTSLTTTYLAANQFHDFWNGNLGEWLRSKGLHIVLVIIAALIGTRIINWVAGKIARRLNTGHELVRSESAKHRAAVASVISSVAIAILYTVVAVDVFDQLGLPIGSLVAPAAVLGAAFGFGAQRIVQDLLSGFFIITEKQYGFGDLVALTVSGSSAEAQGTVEDVTLRVTKLRTSDGEVFTIPNGQIVKALNLSKDWARAVVDIPVPTTADLNKVNDVLHEVASAATSDKRLDQLLLDEPALMGVESIKVDTVNLRMVARTLPGKQFEVGRQLRAMVLRSLRQAGIVSPNTKANSNVAAVATSS
ncbi:mechanosensitive ion channel family protein [Mycolicibacterium sp. P1-5]|uniref:mechanosensitive ion channel family protein n=1 Tax=Mycolicibacterium sp. P1-5 TaxID=2024617 RepID=UPI0011ED1E6B|nr:mechanosensitive ion channel family protein [Mycolicibacterium sp. P1-5]KAA0110656.1 mechanosensitive ion channel family protein [Mycolicibacterium sp. P1-5]